MARAAAGPERRGRTRGRKRSRRPDLRVLNRAPVGRPARRILAKRLDLILGQNAVSIRVKAVKEDAGVRATARRFDEFLEFSPREDAVAIRIVRPLLRL